MTSTESAGLTVAVLVASVRAERIGSTIADWFVRLADAGTDWKYDVIELAELDLPLGETPPGGNSAASPITERLHAADAFVIVTPEYNHSFPAALKNVLDWHFAEWSFKPAAFVSYGGESGGIRAVEQLRLIFPEMYAVTIRTGVVLRAPWRNLDASGAFTGPPAAEQAVTATLRELGWWAAALRTARLAAPYAA